MMRYLHGLSLDLSTEVGCAWGAASAPHPGGLVRRLTAAKCWASLSRRSGEASILGAHGHRGAADNFDSVMDFSPSFPSPEGAQSHACGMFRFPLRLGPHR